MASILFVNNKKKKKRIPTNTHALLFSANVHTCKAIHFSKRADIRYSWEISDGAHEFLFLLDFLTENVIEKECLQKLVRTYVRLDMYVIYLCVWLCWLRLTFLAISPLRLIKRIFLYGMKMSCNTLTVYAILFLLSAIGKLVSVVCLWSIFLKCQSTSMAFIGCRNFRNRQSFKMIEIWLCSLLKIWIS